MTLMIEEQFRTFLISVLSGFFTGICIEIIIALKNVITPGKIVIGIGDILLWLALCGIIIWITFTYNSGQARLYIFLSFFSGIGIYFSTINWVVSKILNYILCHVKRALKNVIFGAKKLVDIISRKR